MFNRKGRLPVFLAGTLAVVLALSGQSFAGEPRQPAEPQVACCAPPALETAIEQRLQTLMQPTLFAAMDYNVRSLVRYLAGQQLTGDTSALLSTVIAEAEASWIVDPNAPEWVALKNAVQSFSWINGWSYDPQIYIPNLDEGIATETDIVVAVAPASEYAESATGYRIDPWGSVYPIGAIDEYYVEYNEVWVLSVFEPVPSGETVAAAPPAKAEPRASQPGMDGGVGTQAVCNPTGIRNNLGQEYLTKWRLPSKSSFGSIFEGKREMRLNIVTSSGVVARTFVFSPVKRKNVTSWQSTEWFVSTWNRALWGDVLAYAWSEIDGGPNFEFNLSVPLPGGASISAKLAWQERDDDGGNAPVTFTESTYTLYTTGSVEFNVCSMGGDGGTGNDNFACAAIASASSTFSGYAPARVADCNQDTRLGPSYSWANALGTYPPNNPEWVQVDFQINRTFRRVVVFTTQGYVIKDFDVQVWNGITFLTVAQIRNNTALTVTATFAVRTSRIVRIRGISGPTHQPGYVRVNELEVYAV